MTLLALAASIQVDCEQLQDAGRAVQRIADYSKVVEDFGPLADELESLRNQVSALGDNHITVPRQAPPPAALEALTAFAHQQGEVDTPTNDLRSSHTAIMQWRLEVRESTTDAYRTWFDAQYPDLESTEALVHNLADLDPRQVASIRSMVQRARVARATVPADKVAIADVRERATALRQALQEFVPSGAVADFVSAALNDGAPLDDLTPEVRTWMSERGFLDKLRIRFAGGR